MSYDNAEPKILKTLNSNGQVLNDSGEVISDTSDYWAKLYNEAEPKPDKILKSDGTIVDSEGNLIQDTTEFNTQKYNQAEPIPAKYLHSNGTIDENPGSGGGADLDNNVSKTIDVSTYTEPVEITPTAGKDGMKKATVTLSNIPSGGSVTAYGWVDESGNTLFFNFAVAPTDKESFNMGKNLVFSSSDAQVSANNLIENINYTKDSDTQFSTTDTAPKPGPDKTYTRDATKDFTLWQVNE